VKNKVCIHDNEYVTPNSYKATSQNKNTELKIITNIKEIIRIIFDLPVKVLF
jgi:hypothetical protein